MDEQGGGKGGGNSHALEVKINTDCDRAEGRWRVTDGIAEGGMKWGREKCLTVITPERTSVDHD